MVQFTIILLLITGMCFFLGFKNRKMLKKVGKKSYFVLTEQEESLQMRMFDSENSDDQKDNENNYEDNEEENENVQI